MAEVVEVRSEQAILALNLYGLSFSQKLDLMQILGNFMMASIRKTFREEGSPAGSWPRLSPYTIIRDPKKYGPGHKLLIDSGRLLNSITFATFQDSVVIGTNLVYAAVHQYGSADRRGAAIGPQARIAGRSVTVEAHRRLRQIHYTRIAIEREDGSEVQVPRPMKTGRAKVINKNGGVSSVTARYEGPLNKDISVKTHNRFQNIPPRPFLVVRPEDPEGMADASTAYFAAQRDRAGLQGGL